MTRKTYLFLIPFLCIAFMGSTKEERVTYEYFKTYFSHIGAFEVGAEDYELSGTVKVLKALFSVTEKMTVKTMDGLLIKTEKKQSHSVTAGTTYNLTFNIPLKSSLTERGLNVIVEFLGPTESSVHSFSFNIKPINPTTINPKSYIDQYYEIKDIVVDPDDSNNKNGEKIKFDKTLDYFNEDNYYRLSLNDTFITYECGKEFPGCLAHLHFTDYLKIFPYLDSDDSVPTFDIPLNTKIKNNGVLFTFPSIMYVKPQTLEMSLVARPGFQATSYFYLPKNRCEPLMDQLFSIKVTGFGYGKTSFTWDMRYTNNHRLIGDCSSSDYCVIGESTNG